MMSVDSAAARARETAETEAAERFAHLRSGAATNADRLEIEAWRASDPVRDDAWSRIVAIWDGSAGAAGDPAIQAMRAAARNRLSETGRSRWRDWRALAVAASVVLLVAASIWLIGRGGIGWPGGDGQEQVAIWSPARTTAIGEVSSFRLDDGSRVTLNTDSALRTAMSSTARRVRLDRGEAYFEVARDSSRPFTVAADGLTATAIGTAFSVRHSGEGVTVTLTEGRLQVATADNLHHAILQPGQQLRLDATGFRIAPVDARRMNSWTRGMLDFDQAPLATVVGEFNRYHERRIVLVDGRLSGLPVTGIFSTGQPDRFVDMLVAANKVRVVRRTERTVELAPR